MSDYLERLIASSLDLGDGRDASTVVRPRRAALFETSTMGDQGVFASAFGIAPPIEETVEETVSRAVPPTDDRARGGPARERGEERSGQSLPRAQRGDGRAPRGVPRPSPSQAFNQTDVEASTVVPRAAPGPDVPAASATTPSGVQGAAASAPAIPDRDSAEPTRPSGAPAERPVERYRREPVHQPIVPAAEQQVESTVLRREATPRIGRPAASHGDEEHQMVRSAVAPAPSSAGPMPGNVLRSAPAVTFGEASWSASPVEPAGPGERPRSGKAGRAVEPAAITREGQGGRSSQARPSFQVEPSSVEVEARPHKEPATTIVVSIGRIEVRAPSAPPATPARPRQPAARWGPALSLDAYLDQRNGARR
ncbi:MAG TPA: hypothetical protein VFH48_27500 [Chloroflexota bacterium]|nr:hypothetical protein [Chloroflexota bacterium]